MPPSGERGRDDTVQPRRDRLPAGRELVLEGAQLLHGEVVQERRVVEPDGAVVLPGEEVAQHLAAAGLVGLDTDESGDGGGAGNPFLGQQPLHLPGGGPVALPRDLFPGRHLAGVVGGDGESLQHFQVDLAGAVGVEQVGRHVAEAPRSRRRTRAGGAPRRARLAAIALAAAMSLAPGVAVAGDYYLRGGVGLDRPGEAVFTDTDCSSTSPAALYGCGTGGEGAPYRAAGNFGTVPAVELGLGYATGAIRFEVLVEYRPHYTFEGRANFLAPERRQDVSAKLSSVTEVFRQAARSRIVTTAHGINRGAIPDLSRPEGESDFYFVAAEDPETAVSRIVELVKTRIPRRFGLDPVRDIQVLCPMNRGGAGARSLNIELQAALNPAGERKVERFGWTFAPGDKVMQIENDYDKEVYNGDIGAVADVDPEAGELTARFEGRDLLYGFGELDALVPAYAATVHKSQGSEYPAVVIPVLTQHYAMLKRNLLYTGVTRGKRLVVLVGQKKAVAIAVRNASGRRRWSKLDEWLAGAKDGPQVGIAHDARSLRERPLTDALPYG